MKDSHIVGAVSLVALLGMLSMAWQFRARVLTGFNDFVSFYSAARLVGTADLYSAEKAAEVQQRAVGVTSESWRYIRLPYFAALLWPLGKLPYRAAYFVWEILGIAALAGFVALLRGPSRSVTLAFSALSLPVFASLMNGQDLTLLLLWIALAISCQHRGKPFMAGLIFSLCAAKYHLFLLVPVLILAQRNFRFARGLLCGGGILAAISFAVGGLSWPRQYYAVLLDPRIHPDVGHMPNLHGLFGNGTLAPYFEWTSAILVAAGTWMIARRMLFDYALAATLAGGLLTSHHAYLPDCSILLPAALVTVSATTLPALRALALTLLIPVSYFSLLVDSPLRAVVPLAILAMLLLMALEAWRRPQCAVRPPAG